MNKYGDYKIYCPNQDTFESEEIAIIDTPRRGPNQNALGNLVLLQAVIYKTIFIYNFKNNTEPL